MTRRKGFVLVAFAAALLSAAAGTRDVPAVAGSGNAQGLGSLHTTAGTRAIRLELPAPAPTTLVIVAAASASAPAVRLTPPAPPITQPAPLSNEDIIRAVWPDELEQRALRIAYRESRYKCCEVSPTNCCYGLFQIYWTLHRSWLAELGITSAKQLYDPWLNARAALALYYRAGGWGPWAL